MSVNNFIHKVKPNSQGIHKHTILNLTNRAQVTLTQTQTRLTLHTEHYTLNHIRLIRTITTLVTFRVRVIPAYSHVHKTLIRQEHKEFRASAHEGYIHLQECQKIKPNLP